MKKKLLIAALALMANMGVFAQGYPVIDVSSIVTAITNGYTMYQQLQTMYSTVKNSYDQLQQQIKSFESFDIKTLNAQDPLGSWRSLNTYADRMMTYEQNIESIINRKDIKVGNGSYSLKDMFSAPVKTAGNMIQDGVHYVIDPLENQLTPEERAAFHKKFGMSYGNYMRFQKMGEIMKKKAAEVVGYSSSLEKDLADDRKNLDEISKNTFDSESVVQQEQINNSIMTIMAQDIKTQANLLGDIAQQLAVNFGRTVIERQAMEDEINMNALNFSQGILKMLDEMPANDYR
ncbi:MAG: hypothetical protein LBG95_01245 [Treponema sp.]|jgi:hypothetical protein|nr:hypothetical protein [Treponema sp.]